MRPCVCVDKEGNLVSSFLTIKEAALSVGLLPDRVRKAIVGKKIVGGYMWLYESDYIVIVSKGKRDILAWGKKKPKWKRGPMGEETKEKIRKMKMRNKMYRERIFRDSWEKFSQHHIQWLHELKRAWLAHPELGIRATLLADYYQDKRDKEIACLASLLIPPSAHCYDAVLKYRRIIGEHPWEWFEARVFCHTEGLRESENARIAAFFNEWWVECFKFGHYPSIEDCVRSLSERDGMTYLEIMERICRVRYVRAKRSRLGELLLVFSKCEGLGTGLWNLDREEVEIPPSFLMTSFLRTWMPDFMRLGSAEAAIDLFGMDRVDFFYCALAYEELKKVRPKECSRYASFFQETWLHHSDVKSSDWRERLPKIDFDVDGEDVWQEEEQRPNG